MNRVYFDEDSDARFHLPEAGTMTRRHLDEILTNLELSEIGVYIVGINAQFVNYRSHVVESYLDEFQMGGGLEQKALRGSRSTWHYRRCANMTVMENAGIDTNQYLVDGARRLGISPWIGIRMNDMHDGHDENSPIHTHLWRKHPELRIPGCIPCENGFDYSHKQVRRMFADLAEEAFIRYRPDNILLDWMRWPAFFPRETAAQSAPLLTELLCEIKNRIGHAPACRVPLTPEAALCLGLDVATWVRQGLISQLFIGNFCSAAEFNAPVEQWKAITDGIPVIVSLERTCWSDGPRTPPISASSAEMRAMAAAAYWRGADGVHPFNCMGYLKLGRQEDLQLLRDLQHPERLHQKNRRHHIGWNDSEIRLGDLDQICRIPGYFDQWRKTHAMPFQALPIKGPASVTMYTAQAPGHDGILTTDALGIKVNGHPLQGTSPFFVPADILKDGTTMIETETDIHELYLDL